MTQEHTFVHIETKQWFDKSGYGSWNRIDLFFCDECLHMKEVKRTKECKSNSIPEIDKPDWYTS